MSNKIYCGNAKEKRFNDGGSIIEVMLDVDVLAKSFKEHGFTTEQGKRKIRIKVCKSREVDQYGNSHYAEVDTWKPDASRANNTVASAKKTFQDDIPDDSAIPF